MDTRLSEIDFIHFISNEIRSDNTIFDPVRKRFVNAFPEELVRQSMIHAMQFFYQIPFSRMAIEREIIVFQKPRRFDILVYDKQGEPYILIECKAPEIKLSQAILDQLSIYNFALKAPYACIFNGRMSKAMHFNFNEKSYTLIDKLPNYPS